MWTSQQKIEFFVYTRLCELTHTHTESYKKSWVGGLVAAAVVDIMDDDEENLRVSERECEMLWQLLLCLQSAPHIRWIYGWTDFFFLFFLLFAFKASVRRKNWLMKFAIEAKKRRNFGGRGKNLLFTLFWVFCDFVTAIKYLNLIKFKLEF